MTHSTFIPLGARCLVKPIEPEKLSDTIIIPNQDKTKSDQGVVMVLGTEPYGHGKFKDPNAGQLVQLSIGDLVLFQKYTGAEFNLGGQFFRVLLYDELLGIIRQTPAPTLPEPSSTFPEALGTTQNDQMSRILLPRQFL